MNIERLTLDKLIDPEFMTLVQEELKEYEGTTIEVKHSYFKSERIKYNRPIDLSILFRDDNDKVIKGVSIQ